MVVLPTVFEWEIIDFPLVFLGFLRAPLSKIMVLPTVFEKNIDFSLVFVGILEDVAFRNVGFASCVLVATCVVMEQLLKATVRGVMTMIALSVFLIWLAGAKPLPKVASALGREDAAAGGGAG